MILVGHEGDYSLDHRGGRWGLRYNRKATLDGTNEDRLLQALGSAARACCLLEDRFDGLEFGRSEFDLFLNDRGLAPNSGETYAAFRPELELFLKGRLGHRDFTLEPEQDQRARFGVTVHLGRPLDLAAMAPC